jgi:hypothetical protein
MGKFINFINKKKKKILDNKIDYKYIYIKLVTNEYIPLVNKYIKKWGIDSINKYNLKETIELCNKLEYKNKVKYINDCIQFIKLLFIFMEECKKYKKIRQSFKKNDYLLNNIDNISEKLKKINNIRRKEKNQNNRDVIGYRIKRIHELYNILSNHNYLLIEKLNSCKDDDFFKIEEYWKSIEEKKEFY